MKVMRQKANPIVEARIPPIIVGARRADTKNVAEARVPVTLMITQSVESPVGSV
jgi:hypothetical protein